MTKLLTATAIAALLVSTPAFAHKKKEKHVVCLINEVYDAETNTCKPIESNDGFVDSVVTDTTETDNDNGDTHEHGRGHEIGRGHFEHGNGKGLGHYK